MSIESEPTEEVPFQEPASCQSLLDEYNERQAQNEPLGGELFSAEMTDRRFKIETITAPFADSRRYNRTTSQTEYPVWYRERYTLSRTKERTRDYPPGREILAGGITIYNPAPLPSGLVAARVEPIDSEISQTAFFDVDREQNLLTQIPDAPILNLQDPFSMEVNGQKFIGGVEICEGQGGVLSYRTVIYRYSNGIEELREQGGAIIAPLVEGPPGMKGVRPVELADGRVGVFTRPQGIVGGRGKIGYTEVGSMEKISEAVLEQAEIIPGLFRDDEWGGVNEAKLIEGSKISVLGHIARTVENPHGPEALKEYYPITFIFDPDTRTFSNLRIIATADCLPAVQPKVPYQNKILYPGGIVENPDGSATLYTGASDVASGTILLNENPFANRV